MALDPKWSEEARKNVKETNIDERMYDRMVKQRERIEADREEQKKNSAMPVVPSYASAVQQPAAVTKQESTLVVPANSQLADEICERLKARITAVVREEINALIEKGRLG